MAVAPADLAELDRKIDAAVTARDTAQLEEILADDYVYTHSTNQHESKREYIAALVTRPPHQRVLSDIEVEIHEDVAVTRGNMDLVFPDRTLYLRYVRIYRSKDGLWRPISHRSVPAPDRAPKA